MDGRLVAFERLLNIMDELRAKCPWDKEQTNMSLRTLTIEEVYELADAVWNENDDEIRKELGDVLLHIVFYSKIASEKKVFDIADVINSLCDKLIFRHPHVFGNDVVNSSGEVIQKWEQLKLKENPGKSSVLGGIPGSLPALIKALRIQEKVRGVGFDWEDKVMIWDKVKEEIAEFEEKLKNNERVGAELEMGDVLFSLVNACRLYKMNPENVLEQSNRKFIRRFNYIEEKSKSMGKSLKDMSLQEMDQLWEEAKKFDKSA